MSNSLGFQLVLWHLSFLVGGYFLGAALIGNMMVAQRLKVAIDKRELPRGIGEVALVITLLIAVGGFVWFAALLAQTFREHATFLTTFLFGIGLTVAVIALSRILVEINFFGTSG